MKLLIAADIFPPEPGGPATYSVTIANEFTKLGDEVRIVSLNPDSDKKAVTCKVYSVTQRSKILRYINYLYLLWKHAKGVDVIYAMGPVNAGLPALIVSKLRGKKLVVKIVGDYAWEQGVQRFGVKELIDEFQTKTDYPFGVRFLRNIQRFVVRNAINVIVPSLYLKGVVMNWGLSGHCVQVVFNSSSFKEMCPVQKPPQERWIISAGRLVSWKGFDTLIGLMPEILVKYPDVRLKIFGDGPELKKLKTMVTDKKLEHVVELAGTVPRSDLLCTISAAEIFVLNSGYEGLSHLILESLYVDTPVLASKVGGNPELIMPDKNGDLFPYNDKEAICKKILQWLDNKNMSWNVGEKEVFFNQFSLANMVKNTREALQNVCKR